MLLVDEAVLRLDLGAVDAQRDAAERLQLKSGGGDDHVGIDALPGPQHDAGGVDVVDVVGDHLDPAVADRLVEVVVEDQAQPLIPRVVARLEVDVDADSLRAELLFRGAADVATC